MDPRKKEEKRISRTAAVYNMIPNLLWTALFLIPVAVFCYHFLSLKTICIVLGISLVPFFFPDSFFDKMQLSRNPEFYKKLGVRYINAFAQNGSLLNKIVRKKHPDFKLVSRTRASIRKQYGQTYFFEKFHFSLFLFFAVVTIYALMGRQFGWVLILSLCNLFYNIYPNLLQQYIRLRLRSSLKATRVDQ